jgi:phage baseplate assembly protein W
MTTFVGFNTINQFKKFTLTDFALIQRDLLNAFNIRQGELPGRPAYGTVMWDFVFENQIEELANNIRREIERVVAGDPRIQLTNVQIYPQENGILTQIAVTVVPSSNAEILSIFFDLQQRSAAYV